MIAGTCNSEVTRSEIYEHLEAIVSSRAFGGSSKYGALLRYLVDSSLEDETRHEVDIAIDVFGKDQNYDPAESSSIRVCVHQLRKKLDEYYREEASGGSRVRLSIPKGSYRISFGTYPIIAYKESVAGDRAVARFSGTRWLVGASALLLISIGSNLLLLLQFDDSAPVQIIRPDPELSFAWQAVTEGPEPLLIVLGDFFVFRDTSAEGRTRFIRDIAVNSSGDLRELAAEGTSVQPADLTYLPKSTAFTLEAILPIVRAAGKSYSLKLISEVTGEDLRQNDVIYIGFIRSMGPLQDHFFRSSSFSSEPPFLHLRDKGTGETFTSSTNLYGQTHDYGLFAKMAGPGKGEILIFTGIRDIGILHAVRALTEPDRARELSQQVATDLHDVPSSFEILFEVSGYDRTDLGATIVRASPAPLAQSSGAL